MLNNLAAERFIQGKIEKMVQYYEIYYLLMDEGEKPYCHLQLPNEKYLTKCSTQVFINSIQ